MSGGKHKEVQIGKGGQGKVWSFFDKDGVKKVRKRVELHRLKGRVPYEVYILKTVVPKFSRILPLEYWRLDHGILDLYFPYCQGGDLEQVWRGHWKEKKPCEEVVWDIFIQIADALAWLHYGFNRRDPDKEPPANWQAVVYRDIKMSNVYLSVKYKAGVPMPDLMLGDFGSATLRAVSTEAGTPRYQGPECPMVTEKTDVWGLGAIIHELCHGEPPVDRRPKSFTDEALWNRSPENKTPRKLSPTDYSKYLDRSMMACLRKKPEDRPRSKQLAGDLLWERKDGLKAQEHKRQLEIDQERELEYQLNLAERNRRDLEFEQRHRLHSKDKHKRDRGRGRRRERNKSDRRS